MMTILFIDDDPDDLELYQEAITYLNDSEYLTDLGEKLVSYMYKKCDNIIDVLKRLPHKPDLIFLDINMPGVGGKECLQSLKSNKLYAQIPVIMLSTNCPRAVGEELKTIGAAECIQKPTDFKELVKIFSRFIFQKL
jgi:CheY-like chemotaxis protein